MRKLLTALDLSFYRTLFFATGLLLLLCSPHAGFMVVFLAFGLAVCAPNSIALMVRQPKQRLRRFARILVWLLTVVTVLTVHRWRHVETRARADIIVQAINAYHLRQGKWPASLDDIGIRQANLRDQLGLSGYRNHHEQVALFYAVTYSVYDVYSYDFEAGIWRYHSG